MKIGVILMIVGMGVLGHAQGELNIGSSSVTVWLQDTAYYPDVNLYWAKRIASSMFAQAGVRIRWQSGQPGSFQAQPPIVLSFTSNTPEKFPPDIFANALVFEGVHIRIFVDHVAERAHHATPLTTYLLAHVMVHEITHMLERVDRHSREGIMKARWTEADIQGMVVKPLSFAAEDIRLIHLGLADRNPAKSQLLSAVSSSLSNREGAYSDRAAAWTWQSMGPPAQMEGVDKQLPAITVYVRFPVGNLRSILRRAEGIASQILTQAGVAIRWRPAEPKAHHEKQRILIDIISDAPATLRPGALAYAEPSGNSHIKIFWDRVNNIGGSSRSCELLGHVLAHEITHILQGVDHHSLTGVMKAHWTYDDIMQMGNKPLAFDPLDIFLIRKGLLDHIPRQGSSFAGRKQTCHFVPDLV
jgi:hypothetical protein